MKKTYKTPGGRVPSIALDILEQPHTLIAGTTGSGKSVLLNTIIYTLLHFAPCQKQMILIDPKKVDLRKYRKLEHTIYHADDLTKILRALKYAESLMDKRYKQMTRRDLELYNGVDVYVIIDELSDILIDSARKEVLPILTRLTRLGRAARVHVIGGTQCPNRKTLSAEFAANCPARVGLRCREGIESRQIIGCNDCIDLPMYGEGFYISPQYRDPRRIAIPMIESEEINRLIKYWTH